MVQPRKRTKQEMIDRATDPDWYGLSDETVKKLYFEGKIKDPLPPDLKEAWGIT